MASKNIGRILSGAVIAFCAVLFCSLSISGQPFKITKLTYTISGSVGLGGVRMVGLPDNPVTDENGYYSATVEHGWSGKVTPQKQGYIFSPPSMTYPEVTSNLDNQNYTWELIKYTISGSVGQEGVVMIGLPSSPVSDSNGTYSATVDYGWSGTVRPDKVGYTFTPSSRTYTGVNRDYANENYKAALITFVISGSVGEAGVVMKGLPKPPISDASGNYSAMVPYNWSGTVTPEKEGFTFNPPNLSYSNIISAQANQDYIAEPITFTISGTIGEAGVTLKGLPNDPVTNSDGTYSVTVQYKFSGKVTPQKAGFTFKPTSMTYTNVIRDFENQDYIAEPITYTISGSVGEAGVVMNGLPGNPVSGDDGTYTAVVPYNWSGEVRPQKMGYTFTPERKIYPSVTANQVNQNYSAARITFTISGSTGVPGVLMKGLPGRVVTDQNGRYSAIVDYGFSGTVTPEKEGYTFSPPSITYATVISAEVNQDYTAALQKRTIFGKITSAEGPIEDVFVLADGGGGSATTNANGEYQLSVDYGWSGTVTPDKEGFTFKPADKKYPPVTSNQTNQNYTAEVVMLTISGTMELAGTPIEGVFVSASNGGGSAVTDAKGHYSLKVPYNWSGKITPKKEGLVFDPPSLTYTNVTTDIVDGQPISPPPKPTPPKPIPPKPTPPKPTPPKPTPPKPTPPKPTPSPGPPDLTTTQGPMVEVDTRPGVEPGPLEDQFNKQRRLLEGQIGTLQRQVDDLLRQLSGEVVGPEVPAEVEPNVPPEVGPKVSPKIGPKVPSKVHKAAGGPLVSIVCMDTDLREVLQELAEQAGVKIYADDTVKGTVTCRIIRKPLEEALQEVLKGTGYLFKEIPNSYLVYKPISNVFVDSELRTALQDIATMAGVVIIPDETVTGVVTADLKDVPLDTALDILLAGSRYVVKKTPYYYLVASSGVEDPAFATVSETQRVKLSYIAADVAIQLLSSAFHPYVQAETGTHTVIVTAPTDLLDRIVSDLNKIDRPPRHVMLDARIVVMERSDLLNLGIEWGWPRLEVGMFGSDFHGGGAADMQFGGRWPWGVQLGFTPDATFTDSLLLTLNLLSQNGEADVVSNPQMLAQDGTDAELRVTNEEYYYLVAPQEVTFYAEAELQQIETGTILTITPRIGDNNDITLTIAAEVSDVVSRGRETEEVLPLVTLSRRRATNTFRVKDGGTVAIAGLTENKTVTEEKRTPGLSSIPILGGLFNNTRKQQSSREIAIFITARLVPEMEELVQFTEPAGEEIPAEPVTEEEFRMRLRRSLLY